MITVAAASEVGLVTGKQGPAQAMPGGKAGAAGIDAEGSIDDLNGWWELLLVQLGMMTRPEGASGVAADSRGVSEAAVQEKGSGGASRLLALTGRKTETGENAVAAACCNVRAVSSPRTALVFQLGASLPQSVHEKQSKKSALEVPDTSEVRHKQADRDSHKEIQEKRHEHASAAAAQAFIPISEPASSVAGPRPLDFRHLQERSNSFDPHSEVRQSEQMEGAMPVSDPVATSLSAATDAPKALQSEIKTEAKDSARVATDHVVMKEFRPERIQAANSERMENGIHSNNSSASRGDEFRISSIPSAAASSSTPSTLPRHSQTRNDRSHQHAVEGRASMTATNTTAGEGSCREAFTFRPEDRTAGEFRASVSRSSVEILDRPSTSPELPLKHSEQQWTHVGPHFAEAGFHDDVLGWVSVRAARDSSGVHAVLVPPSAEAERTLSGHMNGLNTYLGNTQIPVSAVTLSTFENARQAPSFGADAQQHNGRDGCGERNDRPRRDGVGLEPASIAVGSRSQTDSEPYEFVWNRSGSLSSAKTHISLVA